MKDCLRKLTAMNDSSKFLALKDFPVFSMIDDHSLNDLASKVDFVRCEKGKKIYRMDQNIQFVYVILKGSVKIGRNTGSGRVMIKDLVYENEIFGENVFTSVDRRQEFAETIQSTSYFKIPLEVFKDLIVHHPEFADEIMKIIVERLNALESRIRSFVFDKAKQRIVDFIKRTGELRGIKIGLDECLINHGLSHKEIALITDTSRQTVARVLGELKKDNVIHFSARKPSKILIRGDFGLS